MASPERRCIGCGRRGPQSGFIRLSVDPDSTPLRVQVVTKGEHKGRGAYLCKRKACLDRAVQKKAFQKAFRTAVLVDEDEIAAALSSCIDQ